MRWTRLFATLLLLAFQDPSECPKDYPALKKLWASKFKGVSRWTARVEGSKESLFGMGTFAVETRLLRCQMQEEPPNVVDALLWDEVETHEEHGKLKTKILVQANVVTIWNVDSIKAYVCSLSRPKNLVWQWIFWTGLSDELERRFDVVIRKTPGTLSDGKGDPKPAPPEGAGDSGGRTGGVAQYVDPFGETGYYLDLTPRDSELKEELYAVTLMLAPDSLEPRKVWVWGRVENARYSFLEFQRNQEVDLSVFAFDLEGVKVFRK